MMISNDNDPEIEHSLLCGHITKDDTTVEVQTYRLKGATDGWSLEVVDETGASTVWDDLFATDKDAYRTFHETVEAEGMRTFLGHGKDRR